MEKMYTKIKATILYKDGSGVFAEYKLTNDLSFAKSEMKKWIMEQSEKPIQRIIFHRGGNQK